MIYAAISATLKLPDAWPALETAELHALVALSTLAARGRSPVERDGHTREIELIPDAEAPARLAQALARLYRGLLLIGLDRQTAWRYTRKVGLDCMPKIRRVVFECLAAQHSMTTTDAALTIGYPTLTTRRALEDMTVHSLVARSSGGPGKADDWSLTDWCKQLYEATTLSEMSEENTALLSNTEYTYDDISDKVPRCQIGDLVWCLNADGTIANPEPWRIVDIVDDGSTAYALFDETTTGWPLDRCQSADDAGRQA